MTHKDTTAATELLASTTLFSLLPAAALERIAAVAVPRTFPAGTAIFREGDSGESCYVISTGHARALGEHADGRTIALEALAILGSDLRPLVAANPELGLGLAAALARRLRESNRRIARRSFQTVQGRVAAALLELVDQARSEGAGAGEVELVTTQTEIAQLAGTSRESASRFIADLARADVISQGRGRVLVKDSDALEGWVW